MPPEANENLWTVQEAARWSGIRYRSLLALLKDGQVPCLRIGKPKVHNMARGKKRHRACSRYLVPRAAFVRWFENLNPPGHGGAPRKRVA